MDCFWRRYAPDLPLWSMSFVNEWDYHSDYLPWTCSNDEEVVNEEQTAINESGDVEYSGTIIEDSYQFEEPNNIVE